MQLLEALRRVAPVLDKDRPYVRCDGETLIAGNGEQWIVAPIEGGFPFCVAHKPLLAALDRKTVSTTAEADGAGGVTVRGGKRSRSNIQALSVDLVPAPVLISGRQHFEVSLKWRKVLKDFFSWIDPEGATWMQAIHIDAEMIWVANRHAAVCLRHDEPLFDEDTRLSIPLWALKTLQPAGYGVLYIHNYPNILGFTYPDGSTLYTLKLIEDAPTPARNFIAAVTAPTTAVPAGLVEGLTYMSRAGCTYALIGRNAVFSDPKDDAQTDIQEEIALEGEARKWKIAHLELALTYATTLDVMEGRHGTWAGSNYIGIFVGVAL